MYRSWRGVSAHREAMGTLVCWSCTAVTLLVLGFVTKRTAEFSRISMVTWFAVTPVLILAGRIATRRIQHLLHSLGYRTRKFAIVGVNELGFQLARNIEASPEMGLSLAGFFDDRPEHRNPDIPADLGRRVGTIQDLIDQAKAGSDRPHLHHLSHAGGGSHSRRARPIGRRRGLGVHRARFLRLSIAPLAVDRHPRPAGGQRVREPACTASTGWRNASAT